MTTQSSWSPPAKTPPTQSDAKWVIGELLRKFGYSDSRNLYFFDNDGRTTKKVRDILEAVGLKAFFDYRVSGTGDTKFIELLSDKVPDKIDYNYARTLIHDNSSVVNAMKR